MMRLSPDSCCHWLVLVSLNLGLMGLSCHAQEASYQQYHKDSEQALSKWRNRWQEAHSKEEKQRLAHEVYGAAIRADRPNIAEQAVAGGPLSRRQIRVPGRRQRVPLHVVRVFDEIESKPDDECNWAPNQGDGWLARRITRDALEVWTPTHGWLFDSQGRLLNEARPPRGEYGTGREWFGAFLPDGQWVTTDLGNTNGNRSETDGKLSFFSRDSQLMKALRGEELVPPGPDHGGGALLGWARSDKEGTAWVVNVGSEEGYATARVGPDGPAQRLLGTERWQACYPRALGARGSYWTMWTPDDPCRLLLQRREAGHGQGVGYPSYSVFIPKPETGPDDLGDEDAHETEPYDKQSVLSHPPGSSYLSVPNGNAVFGFWPGRRDIFVGAFRATRNFSQPHLPTDESRPRDENATWFFNARGEFRGWLPGRRLADAANAQAMLFRVEASKDVLTLLPSLHVVRTRRFVWPDRKTATALSLFDDLHLGLFRADGKLVLAEW